MEKSTEYYQNLQKEFVSTIAPIIGFENLRIYDALKDALKFQIFKSEYGYVRYEIIMCLLHKFNQSAITLTNHYLEKHLKYVLINNHTGVTHITKLKEDNDKFTAAVLLYGSRDMGKNIDSLFNSNLIDLNTKEKLKGFKERFRNPYSHSDFRGIFKNDSVKLSQHSFSGNNEFEQATVDVANFLVVHGEAQKRIADQEAMPYFLEVDKIVCNYEISRYPYLKEANGDNQYPNY